MKSSKGSGLGRLLLLGGASLLLLDTFLPWQSTSLDGTSYSWNVWHGDKGVLLGALVVVLVAWIAARGLGLALPARVSEVTVTLALASVVLAFAVVKNVHDDDSAWGSYLGVVVTAGVVAAAWRAYQEEHATAPISDAGDPA